MDETRGIRGGRWARAPRGRGRPCGRAASAEPEIGVPIPDDIGIGDGTPVQVDVGVEGRVEVPVQQPLLVDRAGILEFLRELVREVVVAP